MNEINETHDPKLRCWVDSAHTDGTDFPIQNLPFGVFKRRGSDDEAQVGVAIGDQIVDIVACERAILFDGLASIAAQACDAPNLNGLLALDSAAWSALRGSLSAILRSDGAVFQNDLHIAERILVPMDEAELLLPMQIGDYTDFYASVFHATNIGSMFRPDNPLLPNYKYVPIGYHGRSSSIVVSDTAIRRPLGQTKAPTADVPSFGPSQSLDYELELGFVVGRGNQMGIPIGLDDAEQHIFGLCLVNDWSARDIQAWEYQPLGPFLAKNFATTIAPWIVTLEALAPYRCAAFARPTDDPEPLPYLNSSTNATDGGIAITLEVALRTAAMREQNTPPHRLTRGNFRDMYWTIAQMLTHHTSNGCPLRPGDLLASGTISGAEKESRGCLMELTWRGAEPITLPNGEERRFLADGDEVIIGGFCVAEGAARIGFGECRGVVMRNEE